MGLTRCKICGKMFEQMDPEIEEDICPDCWDEINDAIQDYDPDREYLETEEFIDVEETEV